MIFFKNKTKQTCIKRYGKEYYLLSDDAKEKQINARIKRRGIRGSKTEECVELFLLKFFNDVCREYKSDVYPYNCDFYIPSKNLYIEFNGMWVHNNHPYDPIKDSSILCVWEEKSKTSNYYKRAIRIWTIEDVEKRKRAIANNLNWIEAWSIEELNEKIKKIYRLIWQQKQ